MREIKLRAWDKKKKELFHVHELKFHRIDFSLDLIKGYDDWDKDGWTVHGGGNMKYANQPRYELMQYTGLKDKNGKEIYEGDIVEERWNNPLAGGEKVERFRVGFTDSGLYKMYHSSSEERFHRYLHLRYQQIEVIGNAYEMPDWDF